MYNFMQYNSIRMSKIMENWLLVDKVIVKIIGVMSFLRHSVDCRLSPAVFDMAYCVVYTHIRLYSDHD